jgi:acetyltransferase
MDGTLVGAAALVRQAGMADAAAVRDFVCGLSPRTQRLRFFAAVAPPSTGLLRALCGTAGRADVLLVTDSDGTVIAHGMAADAPGGGGVESSIGLVVADAWQQRGIGTQLLRALVTRAARRGVRSLVLEVLPDNHMMLGIIARRWPGTHAEWTPDALVFRPAIQSRASGDNRAPGRCAA